MSSFQAFMSLINDYQTASKALSKCSGFSKRVSNNKQCDLCLFFNETVPEEVFQNELNDLVEVSKTKSWEILISSYHIEKNRIFLKLVRRSVIRAVLVEIFERQSAYGNTNVFHDKTYQVYCDECGRGLTQLRLETAALVVTALITRGGGMVINEPADGAETVCLSQSNSANQPKGHFILVNQASMPDVPDVSEAGFKQLRRGDMLAMGDHKDISELSISKIVDASITFDLLSIKLEKPVVMDSSSQPKSARKSNCKGAPFVLYNYARLCAILDRYDQSVAKGVYQPLPSVKDVNHDLLSNEDEWSLVFDFLVEWPSLVAECQDLDQPKLHRLTGFLSSLASTFSIYYRHSRVLNEGLAHMLPVMEARVHLLLAIKQVFLGAFSLLGIDAPTTM